MPPSKPRRETPLAGLIKAVWTAPLLAVPFALFFGVLNGWHTREIPGIYLVALVFTSVIGLAIWAGEHFALERFAPRDAAGNRSVPQVVAFFGVLSIVAAYAAAVLLHFTLVPSLLGSPSSMISFGMFTLLFTALFMGISLATRFHREALGRARSDQELVLARRIQRSFLITQFPTMPRLEVHALNISSKQVSGDFYDVVPAGDRAFLLAIADVAGKGVPAALLSSMLQASLRTQATTLPSVAGIMKNVNTLAHRSTTLDQFATFFLARVEESSLRMTYTNAGHNYPMLFRRGGERQTLERGGTVVGILEDAVYEEATLDLLSGDRVVLYTDGIVEAMDRKGELFGEERLEQLVRGLPETHSAERVIERILEELRAFLDGEEAGDDMTLMVLRVLDATDTDREMRP